MTIYKLNSNSITANSITTSLIKDGAVTFAKTTGFGSLALLNSLSTGDVNETTNLYFSNARVYDNVTQLGYITSAALSGYSTNAQLVLKANIADLNTSNVAEGTNLYFSNSRARGAISVTGAASYDGSTGVINVTGGVTSVGGATGAVSNAQLAAAITSSGLLTTSNVSEGTNLYFSNTRARDALSGGTGVTYNSSTGQFSIGQAVGTNNNVTFANVTVTGNLLVQGNAVQFTANNLIVSDPLIQMGVNPVGDSLDLGFFAHYIGGSPSIERHAGLFRDATDGQFKLFTNLDPEPTTIVDTANATYQSANLVVNFVVGKVTDISNHSTTNLAEGTNLYFTNTRVDSRVTTSIASTTLSNATFSGNVTAAAFIGNGSGLTNLATSAGYFNSSLTAFPSGDLGDLTSSTDAFGIALNPTFDCMDPSGSLDTEDLGVLT